VSHTLIFGFDEQMAAWACERIPWMKPNASMRAVGVADGAGPEARMLAAIIFQNYMPPETIRGVEWYNTVEVSFAAASPRFATRGTISSLLKIPFDQYKVRQVLLSVPSINKRALRFVKGIGFTSRGIVAHYYGQGIHAHVLGLHREVFRHQFLKRKKPATERRHNGQAIGGASASSAQPL